MINSFKNPAIMRILRTTERYEAGWREQNFITSDEERRMALSMIDAQYRRINLMVDDAINGIREHQKLDQFLSQRKLNPYDF